MHAQIGQRQPVRMPVWYISARVSSFILRRPLTCPKKRSCSPERCRKLSYPIPIESAKLDGNVCTRLDTRKGGCGNTCNCPNEVSCTSGAAKDQCYWSGGACHRIVSTAHCNAGIQMARTNRSVGWGRLGNSKQNAPAERKVLFTSGSAPGAFSTCYGFDKRVGSCNSTCNCGNQVSCLAAAKAGCVWTGEACVRQYVNSTNGECNCQCGDVLNKIYSLPLPWSLYMHIQERALASLRATRSVYPCHSWDFGPGIAPIPWDTGYCWDSGYS